MADGPALALQKAVIAALRLNAGVAGMVAGRVYDEPPPKVVFPYVRLGTFERQPFRTSCETSSTITFGVECHSRPAAGRVEVTRTVEAVVAALDEQEDALDVDGFTVEWVFFETQSAGRATDGKSHEAVAVFTASLA